MSKQTNRSPEAVAEILDAGILAHRRRRLRARALAAVSVERERQDAKFGALRDHADGTDLDYIQLADEARDRCERAFREGRGTWRHILEEEVFEALGETAPDLLAKELVQVAAVCVAWLEALDARRTAVTDTAGK